MSAGLNTIKDIREHLIKELKDIYPDNEINSITNLIFKTLFGYDRLHILLNPDFILSPEGRIRIIEIVKELRTGKPVQYILGETFFFNCIIKVSNATLIPRPETEELVDLIIIENRDFKGKIIDIGTGSGCIAISLKKNLKNAEVTGIDISEEALKIARTNAILNDTDVSFRNCDILQFDHEQLPVYNMIVSNPPYVMESEKQFMRRNVLDFEPHKALFVPDNDPLVFYRTIINLSEKTLAPGGKIYLEINENKGEEIYNLLDLSGLNEIKIINDINGKNRFIKGRKNGQESDD
jgi:release factor glutamine methyltransferase